MRGEWRAGRVERRVEGREGGEMECVRSAGAVHRTGVQGLTERGCCLAVGVCSGRHSSSH